MKIGAHMSVAGGVSKAVERAVLHGCEALQIFSRNASQWKGAPLDPAEIRTFRRRVEETQIAPVVAHASYLINLATTFPLLREQSLAAFLDEIDRAEALGLMGVVIHPGTNTAAPERAGPGPASRGAGSESDALRLIGEAIRTAFTARPRGKARVLLEHTAGQGRTVGHRFEHLATILEHVDGSPRVGVCLDTCHLVASGYDIVSDAGYRETFEAFDRIVGLERVHVFHGNDSKKPCGSRIDRHEHIGAGCLGLEPFRRLLNDERFDGVPMLIETEKTSRTTKASVIAEDPLDVRNLTTLRGLRDPTGRESAPRPGSSRVASSGT